MGGVEKHMTRSAAKVLVRAGIYAGATWLLSKGYITEEQGADVKTNAGEIAAGLILYGGALAWGLRDWWRTHRKIDRQEQLISAALDLPAGTPRDELERAA